MFSKKIFYRWKLIFISFFSLLPKALPGQIFFWSYGKTCPNSNPQWGSFLEKFSLKKGGRAKNPYLKGRKFLWYTKTLEKHLLALLRSTSFY